MHENAVIHDDTSNHDDPDDDDDDSKECKMCLNVLKRPLLQNQHYIHNY